MVYKRTYRRVMRDGDIYKAAMANKIASQRKLVINAKKKITSWYIQGTECCAF